MNDIVELGLRRPTGARTDRPADGGFSAFVDRLLLVLAQVAPDSDPRETAEFQAKVAHYRGTLSDPAGPAAFLAITDACIKACDQYLKSSQRYHTSREKELTELIAILREAASAMVGDSKAFNTAVLSSSERFSNMTQVSDIRDLKRQISAEVSTLKRSAEDKQQRDDKTFAVLSKRVEVLEYRLVQAEEEAAIDPLTRIANRGSFDRTLRLHISAAANGARALTLAMIDLDDFKKVNDEHGHPVGDRVLLCAAQWLGNGLRKTDFVARYGGEEFAVILTDANLEQSEMRFTRLVAEIANRSFVYDVDGSPHAVRFTLSCGVAELASGESDEDLVRRADQALLDAKRAGKNRVVARKRSRLGSLLGRG